MLQIQAEVGSGHDNRLQQVICSGNQQQKEKKKSSMTSFCRTPPATWPMPYGCPVNPFSHAHHLMDIMQRFLQSHTANLSAWDTCMSLALPLSCYFVTRRSTG
jgi:hypothetical protein